MRFIRFIFITLAAIVAPVCIVGQVALTTGTAEEESISTDAASTTPMPLKMRADSLMRCYEAAKQSATADKPYIYNLLNECFERNTEYLQSADITPTDYVAVKDRLRQLHPQLQFAGVFFAQQGDNTTAVSLLEKYINMPHTEAFKNERVTITDNLPTLLYFVASNKFNTQDFDSAIKYLKAYLDTHDVKQERTVLMYLSKAYGYKADDENQILTLMRGVQLYPNDRYMLHDIVMYHIRSRNVAQAELYLPAYEATDPKPTDLYELRAGIAEIKGDYFTSLKICEKLYEYDRNNLDYAKMLARSSYNYVVMEMNNGRATAEGSPAPDLIPYLENAAKLFVQINNEKPQKLYLDGLIDTYLLLGRRDEAQQVAQRIGRQIESRQGDKRMLAEQHTGTSGGSGRVTSTGVPLFSLFLQTYLDDKLRTWMQKDPFEKTSDYEERTTGEGLEAKKQELLASAKEAYIRQYSATMQVNNITIGGYDADHEVYLIHYNHGDMLVHVPLEGEQAQKFQTDWANRRVNLASPKFDISGDSLVLARLDFVSQSGFTYHYDMTEALKYEDVDVKVSNPISLISGDLLASLGGNNKSKQYIENTTIEIGSDDKKSDIDVDIPVDSIQNLYTFVLVISNENYEFVDKVSYALNDGCSFVDYCRKTLGIPKKNITHVSDASFLQMQGKINVFCDLAREYSVAARVIVYYSGHGIPNMETQEAFMLATDGSPLTMTGVIKLDDFYEQLASTGVKNVSVFLDCCFSGASKAGNMLVSARGTVIKPRDCYPRDNMVVMTACSGDEIAFPYNDQRHGMFTYFLLKKLKETNGEASLGELFDYVQSNVRRQSLHDKQRRQIPSVNFADGLTDTWQSLRLK